ncbi:MAG: hypothetical protein AAF368_09910, partial [Planctomycetota bacterium]
VPEELRLEDEPMIGPDGKSYPIQVPILWSPDGKRVAYSAIAAEGRAAVVNDSVLGIFDFCDPPSFSSDGAHYVFRIGMTKSKKQEVWWTLLDGEKQNKCDWLGSVQVLPDGATCYWEMPGARIQRDGSYKNKPMLFRTPFRKGKKWNQGRALQAPVIAEDGTWCATYGSLRGDDWTVVLATKKGEKAVGEPSPFIADFAISQDGKQVATVERESPPGRPVMRGRGFKDGAVLRSGKKEYGEGYDDLGVPQFTPDGKHLAYKVDRGGKMGIAFDGDKKVEPEWDFVWSPKFSQDSKRFVYVANRGGEVSPFWRMSSEGDYVDAEGGENFVIASDLGGKKREEWGPFGVVTDLVISADGKLVAFVAEEEGGWRIHCGEAKSELYDEVGTLIFAEDGEKLAFGARSDRELWWRVLELEEDE